MPKKIKSKTIRYRDSKGRFSKFRKGKKLRRIIVDDGVYKEGVRYIARDQESKLGKRYKEHKKVQKSDFKKLSKNYSLKEVKYQSGEIGYKYKLKKSVFKKHYGDMDWFVDQVKNTILKSDYKTLQVKIKFRVYDEELQIWLPITVSTALTRLTIDNIDSLLDDVYAQFLDIELIAENYRDSDYEILEFEIEGR